MDIANIGSVCS